ncbi:MAG TPA: HDIG domain-containing protein [Anaerolineae bacterium]|nr:HDIG domain-containing protein [Anaerolineae bacterium]HQH37215.1 HDIG domain-containing protein [Anaerolineae bacterium]
MTDFSLYAGRWIALTETAAVAGVGMTREEARCAARATRPKERLRLAWVAPHPPYIPLPEWPLVHLKTILPAEGIWLAGGPVRDLLLGCDLYDWDFAVAENGREMARKVANVIKAAYYPLDEERDTGRVIVTDPHTHRQTTLDFATLRGATLEEDLRRRDFTINAMALTFDGILIDPTTGQADLSAGIIRMTGPSSFKDDPVRLLRAVRQANALHFRFDTHTAAAMRTQASSIITATPERIRTELLRMLHAVPAAHNLQTLSNFNLLNPILPEIQALQTVLQTYPHNYANAHLHTLATIAAIEGILALIKGEARPPTTENYVPVPPWTWPMLADALLPFQSPLLSYLETPVNVDMLRADLLKWGALFHDVGKSATRTVDEEGHCHFYGHAEVGAQATAERLEALRFPGKANAFIVTLVAEHMRLANINAALTRRAAYRFYRDTGDAGVGVVLLALADAMAVWGHGLPQNHWRALLCHANVLLTSYFERSTEVIAPPPLLNGYDLMALGVPQGPQLGRLLETLHEAQAAGEITTREAAEDFVSRTLTGG